MDLETYTGVSSLCLAAVLLTLERFPGIRRASAAIGQRWLTNLGLWLLAGNLVSAIYSESITAIAAGLQSGLVRDLELPFVLEAVLVCLILDGWRYWQHRLLHEIPMLWRIHLVHHSDTALDVTTSQRHHPFEGLVTIFLTLILVFALGFSAQALALYLLLAALSSVYTHANIALPECFDRPLRWFLVTPSVHAIHHSSFQPETDSNYGSVLTLWDRLFGTYRDPSATQVAEYGLEYFRGEKDTALASALLQPFTYRRGTLNTEYHAEASSPSKSVTTLLSQEWRLALRYFAVGFLLALTVLWPTAVELARAWMAGESYQYAWLVLPMFIYAVGWYHRETILLLTPRPCHRGLVVIGMAAALWSVGDIADIKLAQQLALVLTVQGIALCALGWQCYRALLPSFLLLFLMVPCGDVLQPLLRSLTVKWIEWFALLTGLPHVVEGYVIHIGTHRYVVIDACSGLTFFTLAGFLGYSFGLLLFRSLPKVLALAALGALLGILTNAARVCLIVGIDWLNGSQMDLGAHQDVQWLVMLVSLASLLYLAGKLAQDAPVVSFMDKSSGANIMPSLGQLGNFAPVIGGLIIMVSVGITQGLLSSPTSNSTDYLAQMATFYPESRWLEKEEGDQQALGIRLDDDLNVVLIAPGRRSARLDMKSLLPVSGAVWRHSNTAQYQDCLGTRCVSFVHKTFREKGTNNTSHTFYAYFVEDRLMNTKLSYRLMVGWNRILGREPATGLIGFMVLGDLPESFSIAQDYQQIIQKIASGPLREVVSS
jgi:exosortase